MIGIFPGCTLEKYSSELKEPLVKILKSLGIEWVDIGSGRCCGMPLLLSGDIDGFNEVVKSNIDYFKDVPVIITSCAGCFRVFKEYYSSYRVRHLSQFILDLGVNVFREVNLKAVYHDPCELIHCGVTEEPRALLRKIPGLKLSEFNLSRESSTCCGGGGLVKAVFPSLAVEVAYEKILRELPPNVEAIISSCPFCYLNFKDASSVYSLDIKVYDIIHVLGIALGVL